MNLTRDQILDSHDLPTETVDVPEWGGSVTIRTMSAGEREAFGDAFSASDKKNWLGHLAIATICDDSGAPIFTLDDLDFVTGKSGLVVFRLCQVARRLNGFLPEEEVAKNSLPIPSVSSVSASPAPSGE